MKYLERSCPRCRGNVSFSQKHSEVQCPGCHCMLELEPKFLQSFTSKLLFLSGAVLLGNTLSDWLTTIGIAAVGTDRLFVDLVTATGYYCVCRFIFFAFQRPQARP